MTTIVITETLDPRGKYWAFRVQGNREIVARVDRSYDTRGYSYYKVYLMSKASDMQTRGQRKYAFELAKRMVKEEYPDAVFKMNAVTEHVKISQIWRSSCKETH